MQLFLYQCTTIRGTKLLILNALNELAWEIQLAIAQLFMFSPQIFLLVWCVDSKGLCSHSTKSANLSCHSHNSNSIGILGLGLG